MNTIREQYAVTTVSGHTGEPLEAEQARLVRLVSALAPRDGIYSQPIPGLYVSRYSSADTDTIKTFYSASLIIVVQGAKRITIGQELYDFDTTRMILLPVALPVAMRLTDASPSEPYLGVKLELDPQRIGDWVLKLYPRGLPALSQTGNQYMTEANPAILNAVIRLLECLQHPADVELLAPLVADELLLRILRSPVGVRLALTCLAESDVQRVAKVISWLQKHFSQPVKVAELAELAHMSTSSFHVHFKSVTSMSPLQSSRRLLIN